MSALGRSDPGHELHISLDLVFFWLDKPFDLVFARYDANGRLYYTRRGQQVPNFLCWVRIAGSAAATVTLIWSVATHNHSWATVSWYALLVFVLTDGMDGRIARHQEERGFVRDPRIVERGGKLDPFADKLANVAGAVAAFYIMSTLAMSVHVMLFLVFAGLALGVDAALSLIALLDDRHHAQIKALLAKVTPPDGMAELPVLRTFSWGKVKMLLYAIGFMVALYVAVGGDAGILMWAWPMLLAGMPFGFMSLSSHLDRYAQLFHMLHSLQAAEAEQLAAMATKPSEAATSAA